MYHVPTLPFLGALPRFLLKPFTTLEEAMSHGDVSRLDLALLDVILLHHPDHVDHVLRKHRQNYPKGGPHWESIRSVLGNGLPVSQGKLWLRQRRMMQPQFRRSRIAELAPDMVLALRKSLRWPDVDREWSTVNIGERISKASMDVVVSAVLGSRISREDASAVADDVRVANKFLFRAAMAGQLPQWCPVPGKRRFAGALEHLRSVVEDLILGSSEHESGGGSLLSLLVSAIDEDTQEGMSHQQLVDEVMSLFLAGFDTTSNGLQWSVYYLSRHPECMSRLREEVAQVLGPRDPTWADVQRLEYARWTMQEALRLHPPAWWFPRVAAEDDEIGRCEIPAGTVVAPVAYTIHRHPEFWSDPARFDPTRFEPSQLATQHRFAWVPFGAGPNQCIGKEVSLMSATMMLAMITQRYEIASVDHQLRSRMGILITPAEGCRVGVRRRRT